MAMLFYQKIKDSGGRELGHWQENDSFVELWEGNDRRLISKNMGGPRDCEVEKFRSEISGRLYEVVVRK